MLPTYACGMMRWLRHSAANARADAPICLVLFSGLFIYALAAFIDVIFDWLWWILRSVLRFSYRLRPSYRCLMPIYIVKEPPLEASHISPPRLSYRYFKAPPDIIKRVTSTWKLSRRGQYWPRLRACRLPAATLFYIILYSRTAH